MVGRHATRAILWTSIAFALVLVFTSHPASANTVTLTAVHDNTLFEDPQGSLSNGAGAFVFAGVTNQGLKRRALLRFDLHTLPAGASVTSVTLRLVLSQTTSPPSAVSVHRVLQDWGEGASDSGGSQQSGGGVGAPSETNDATWLHTFFPNQFWVNVGGDFAPEVSATQTVGALGTYEWTSSALTADVSNWAASPSSNHGWILLGDETQTTNSKRFNSRENLDPTTLPVLVIVFTPAPAPALVPAWSTLAACGFLLLAGVRRASRLRL